MENSESQFDTAVNSYMQDLIIPEFKPPTPYNDDEDLRQDADNEVRAAADEEDPQAKQAVTQRQSLRSKLINGYRQRTNKLAQAANRI